MKYLPKYILHRHNAFMLHIVLICLYDRYNLVNNNLALLMCYVMTKNGMERR